MTTEEKAKAYGKALEWMRKVYPTLTGADKEDVEYYFPELKESEDERIRKFLVELVSNDKANNFRGFYDIRKIDFDNILAWLEKQKEQKPADLVEEAYIENRNDGTHTCATTKDGFDAFMDGFNKGYELGMKEQTKNQ